MSSEAFSPDWLALREAADHRSRARPLVSRLRAAWRAHGWTRLVDLGSGTGSNLRYLAPRLPGRQEWTLIDHDARLLARVEAPRGDLSVTAVMGDLDDQGIAAVAQTDLLTCSALTGIGLYWLGG